MSGKRLRGPDILPPRLKRRAVSGDNAPVSQSQSPAQSLFHQIGSQPAERSGLEYVALANTNTKVVGEMLSGLRHDADRSDLFIGLALLSKRNATLFQSDFALQHLFQFLMDPETSSHSLQLITELIETAFPTELPFLLYKFYIDSFLDESPLSKWLGRDELTPIVSRLQLLSSAPDTGRAAPAGATDDEEELIQESGNVSVPIQAFNLQQQVGAYVMSKLNGSPTAAPSSRFISLLAQACVLADCRAGALRFLAGVPSSTTITEPIRDLMASLCQWVVNKADFVLLNGLLALPIAIRTLASSVLSTPRFWQAALLFLLSQDKITTNSQPDVFHAIFSQSELVRTTLPKLCSRYLSNVNSGSRSLLRLQAVLHWACCNPAASPYVQIPEFPLLLLDSVDQSELSVIGLASFLGNFQSGVKAADFQLEAVRLLNRRCSEGNISGDLSAVVQVLLAQHASAAELSFPIHCDTILHILSLSIMHHQLDSSAALAILECAAVRSLAQSIATPCNADGSRSVCEAIMQLPIIAGPELVVQSVLYWKAITVLVLLSAVCPGSIGVFAYKRIANICEILNAIITVNWELISTIPDTAMPERLPLSLGTAHPVPDSVLANIRHLSNNCSLADHIISNDQQFQLVTLFSDLQSPKVLCDWLLPVLNETASCLETVPVIVLSHLLQYLGDECPSYIVERVQQCCTSYIAVDQSSVAVSVIQLLLKGLSHSDPDLRMRSRRALEISFQTPPDRPFSFLSQRSVCDLGAPLIRSAIQIESSPDVLTNYLRFLIDRTRPESLLNETFIRYLYDNILLRSHIARALLTNPSLDSGLNQVIHAIVSNHSTENLSEFILDALVLTASHGGIPLPMQAEMQNLLSKAKLSSRHLDLLLEGCAFEGLQMMSIGSASAEQVRRFARGFGRSQTLLDACRLRLQSLGLSESESANDSIPQSDSNQLDDAVDFTPIPINDALEDTNMAPAIPEVQLISAASARTFAIKKFDLTVSNLEVVTPRFHPYFHTFKHKDGAKSAKRSAYCKERLLDLWSTGQYDEVIAAVKDL